MKKPVYALSIFIVMLMLNACAVAGNIDDRMLEAVLGVDMSAVKAPVVAAAVQETAAASAAVETAGEQMSSGSREEELAKHLAAYQLYAEDILAHKALIDDYNWQYDQVGNRRALQRHVSLVNIYGDSVPELIYIARESPDSQAALLRILSVEGGALKPLYDYYWDSQVGGGFFYKLFTVCDESDPGEAALYAYTSWGDDYLSEEYGVFTMSDGMLDGIKPLFSHRSDPDYEHIVNAQLNYIDSYAVGDQTITEQEYRTLEQQLTDRTISMLMFSDRYESMDKLDELILSRGCPAMTADEALLFLDGRIRLGFGNEKSSKEVAEQWVGYYVLNDMNDIEITYADNCSLRLEMNVSDAAGTSVVHNEYQAYFTDPYCTRFTLPYQSGILQIFDYDGSHEDAGISVSLSNGMLGANDGYYAKQKNGKKPGTEDKTPYFGNGSSWGSGLFTGDAFSFNADTALAAAMLSQEAEGSDDQKIQTLYGEYDLWGVKTYNYGGDGAFSFAQDILTVNGWDTNILIINARGTMPERWREVMGDWLKGGTDSFLGYEVWDNAYDFEEDIWDALKTYLNDHPYLKDTEHLKILVTGHSLGGAAADLIGARIDDAVRNRTFFNPHVKLSDVQVYTFGTIKVLKQIMNVSSGYENIHNVYNYYDTYGPHGNFSMLEASSANGKFGHTEMFSLDKEDSMFTNKNHWMSTYMEAIEKDRDEGGILNKRCR